MAQPHVTRTLGPIHFEDLDPHRFEDLIRQLAYDFRSWKSIESTGRGGADDGFDVRAFEEVKTPVIPLEDDVDAEDAPHPMEGNLWMIQCNREPRWPGQIPPPLATPNSPRQDGRIMTTRV